MNNITGRITGEHFSRTDILSKTLIIKSDFPQFDFHGRFGHLIKPAEASDISQRADENHTPDVCVGINSSAAKMLASRSLG